MKVHYIMYKVSGANLHGQWLEKQSIISEFETIRSIRGCEAFVDINQAKLLHISWSYNLYQNANKFYLSGSWLGNASQFIEIPLPKDYLKKNKVLLTGNEHYLFMCDTKSHIISVMNLEDPTDVKDLNISTETFVASPTKRLKRNDSTLKINITDFSCVYLSAHGNVYTGALPSPTDTSMCADSIRDVQCGYEHFLLLTDAGQVYSWGNGRKLQLGHGNLNNIELPVLIEALAGVRITQISAGGWHSLALSEFGDVYAWGWNDMGQLGIKEDKYGNMDQLTNANSYALPTLVDIYDANGDIVNISVKKISCGSRHSAILLEDNTVWSSGCNKYGQTGFKLEKNKVDFFKKSYQCSDNSDIKCGPWVTVIIN